MENNGNFRGKLFGGFNRHDVISYLEILSRESNALRIENDSQKEKIEQLEAELSELRPKAEQISELESRLKEAEDALSEKNRQISLLEDSLETYMAAAKEYAAAKERLVEMELSAHMRAKKTEQTAVEQSRKALSKCADVIGAVGEEYATVISDTEETAAHVRGELCRLGAELDEIIAALGRKSEDFGNLKKTLEFQQGETEHVNK